MIQLEILSGKMAGRQVSARRFPFQIGRSTQADLRLDDSGVWAQHAEIGFQLGRGFRAEAIGEALLLVNGNKVTSTRLRAGDLLDLGGAKLRFWLTKPVQRGLTLREACTWLLIAGIIGGEVALVYLLV